MRLHQNSDTGYWTQGPGGVYLNQVHSIEQCINRGCAIHNRPSDHPLKKAPLNWRPDRNILERICEHGVGHPDADAAEFQRSIGRELENVHGCCGYGCCSL